MSEYALIGNYGEDFRAVIERLVVCLDCGAAVRDTELHDRFHAAPDDRQAGAQ